MRKFLYAVLFVILGLTLQGCQGFLEDYNYSPVGSLASNPT